MCCSADSLQAHMLVVQVPMGELAAAAQLGGEGLKKKKKKKKKHQTAEATES